MMSRNGSIWHALRGAKARATRPAPPARREAGLEVDMARIRERLAAYGESRSEPRTTVLVVASHPDDEFIALAATLRTLAAHGIVVFLVIMCADDPARRRDACEAAAEYGIPGENTFLLELPDDDLTSHRASAREVLSLFVGHVGVVFTHAQDSHPDHSELASLVARTFARAPVTILRFPIPQRVPSEFLPNTVFLVAREHAESKLAAMRDRRLYGSEMSRAPDYFAPVVHAGLLRRGGLVGCHDAGEILSCELARLAPCRSCGALSLAPDDHSMTISVSPVRLILRVCPCGSSISAASHEV